jgi:predicted nuclease with TOPRIM domain
VDYGEEKKVKMLKEFINGVWTLGRNLMSVKESIDGLTTELTRLSEKMDVIEADLSRLSGRLDALEGVLHRLIEQ